eukprot:1125252-Prymnesium_polylepis.2
MQICAAWRSSRARQRAACQDSPCEGHLHLLRSRYRVRHRPRKLDDRCAHTLTYNSRISPGVPNMGYPCSLTRPRGHSDKLCEDQHSLVRCLVLRKKLHDVGMERISMQLNRGREKALALNMGVNSVIALDVRPAASCSLQRACACAVAWRRACASDTVAYPICSRVRTDTV